MLQVVPDYYKEFRCIAGRCRHSCCIGWEIDVDADALAFYEGVPGAFGARLRAGLSREGTPHFILGEGERCPFLNGENLCDLILTLGEEHLCGICAEHPRFHNRLPGRVESGLGLCCEEAARLILSRQTPMTLVAAGEDEADDPVIALRDELLACLQDRSLPIDRRVDGMLGLLGLPRPHGDMGRWADFLLGLEQLDGAWGALLRRLKAGWQTADRAGFDAWMQNRQTEYEQFLVYLIYRHAANAVSGDDLAARVRLAAFGWQLLRALGAVLWTEQGRFDFEDQAELARLFSSELEYSEENLDALLDELVPAGG